ncbi:MBL fold metallo-hydrolase [Azospirillum sp. ST 5-10]|uniref:MBL fold metallo-hydrolase n=1 Tax=unclassified Azospirillum TaxID=2630922 RepID=UPI003F4A62E5
MDIRVLGVGEAADPDLPNSSVTVAADGFRVLVDCGHSVPPVLWRAHPGPDAVDAVVFTHHHPDHCFGLVPVLIRWTDQGRTGPLDVVTTRPGRRQLLQLLEAGSVDPDRGLSFPLRWHDVLETGRLGPFALATAPTRHALPNRALRFAHGGAVFAYSGDGRPTAESEALFRGADLLFHECYTVAPDPAQAFHAAFPMMADLPERLGVGALRLYHVRADQRAALAAACSEHANIALAVPGSLHSLAADAHLRRPG